jgi:hypothetical protein
LTETKRKVKFFESASITTLENMYLEWVNEKGDTISNINEQFSVEGAIYHIAVFFTKEIE